MANVARTNGTNHASPEMLNPSTPLPPRIAIPVAIMTTHTMPGRPAVLRFPFLAMEIASSAKDEMFVVILLSKVECRIFGSQKNPFSLIVSIKYMPDQGIKNLG